MQTDDWSASVEEACLNAWPALKEIFYDGWLIRLAEGETRRTNSVNVIGPGRYAVADKIAYCEAVYRAHGQPTYFRIRSNDDPALDALLAARGFRAEDETHAPCSWISPAHRRKPLIAISKSSVTPPSLEWLAAHARFTGRPVAPIADDGDIRRRLLDLVGLPIAFAAARDGDGHIVSLAYGALHDRLVSLQWVATDPARRREGLSRAVLSALLGWARDQGATGACLQVVGRPMRRPLRSTGSWDSTASSIGIIIACNDSRDSDRRGNVCGRPLCGRAWRGHAGADGCGRRGRGRGRASALAGGQGRGAVRAGEQWRRRLRGRAHARRPRPRCRAGAAGQARGAEGRCRHHGRALGRADRAADAGDLPRSRCRDRCDVRGRPGAPARRRGQGDGGRRSTARACRWWPSMCRAGCMAIWPRPLAGNASRPISPSPSSARSRRMC